MNNETQLLDILQNARGELECLSRSVRRAIARLSHAQDPELRTAAKAMRRFRRTLTRHQQSIARRARRLQLEFPVPPIKGDPALRKDLHAFAREHIGVARGELDAWAPLRQVMPEEWRHGFMFMGVIEQGTLRLHKYKHGITRRCLCLDAEGRAYRYDAAAQAYVLLEDAQCAVQQVFADLEQFGATRETVYDELYREQRDTRPARAGFNTLTINAQGVSQFPQTEAEHGK